MNVRAIALFLSLFIAAPALAQDATPEVDVADVVAFDDTAVTDTADSEDASVTEDASGAEDVASEEDVEVPLIEEVPETYDDAEEAFIALLAAGKAGEWSIFAGLLLMLLIFVGRRYIFPRLTGAALAWTTAGTGTAAFIAIALAAGTPILTAVVTGFMTGAMATGLWELIGKTTVGK